MRGRFALFIAVGSSLACLAGPAPVGPTDAPPPAGHEVGRAPEGTSGAAAPDERRAPTGVVGGNRPSAPVPAGGSGDSRADAPVGGGPFTGPVPSSRVALDRGALERALQDVEGVGDLGDVLGLAPRITLRGLQGVEVTAIPPGSPFAGLGLRPGDVIVRVNGADLTSLEAALMAGQALEHASTVDAVYLRDGRPQSLVVDLR